MPLIESLLTTKTFLPPVRATLVARPRLLALLSEGIDRPLTLISAPAGFGKTTLLSEWHASEVGRSFPLVWISLDNDDNDSSRFLRYLITTLGTLKAGIGISALAALQLPQPPPPKIILTDLINDLNALSTSSALVFDDYHVITSQDVHEILNFFLDHLPPKMHLVLLTRADPPLPLARLRARNQLTEIRTADLRFTQDESTTFLNDVMGLELPIADIDTLETRTEGWIAGLQLAAFSLRQQTDKHAFVATFSGDDRYVVDYLLEEVLQRQSPEVQSFLLQTSILERLCDPLCEAVTGEANNQAILEYLEQTNLFVTPLDNQRYWYRYHHLFADLLRWRLRKAMASSEWMTLYRRACSWYEHQGFIVEAVSQALAAPDFTYTTDLLKQHALTIFFRGENILVHRWLQSLPEDVLRSHPLLCAIYANTIAHTHFFKTNSLQLTEYWLQSAEHGVMDGTPSPDISDSTGRSGNSITRSFISLSRAYLTHWRNEAPQAVIDLAQQALASLPPVDQVAIDPNYLRFHSGLNYILGLSFLRLGNEGAASIALSNARRIGEVCGDLFNACAAILTQSAILRSHGHLHETISLFREALTSLGNAGDRPELSNPYVGMIYVAQGLSLLECNDLDTAEYLLSKGLELSRLTTGTDIQPLGFIALARIKRMRGDLTGALDILKKFEGGTQETTSLVLSYRVRLLLAQGNRAAALQWAQVQQFTDTFNTESLTLTRVLIAQSQTANHITATFLPSMEHLHQFLDSQLQVADANNWIERTIELLILKALANQAQNETTSALNFLQRALELAEPRGYVCAFIEEGIPMHRLLVKLKNFGGTSREYINKLLSAWENNETVAFSALSNQSLVEPLSTRELEVLRLLVTGASNNEIAQKLVITLNTTKKHITHIFEKLAVTKRDEAAIRARELGLVP